MEQKIFRWWKTAGFMLLLSVAFSGKAVLAQEQMVIKVGYSNSEFLYAGSKNAYEGYGYELLQTIAQYEPVKYRYVYANPKELKDMLEKGEIDVLAPMRKTKKLEETFDFTDLSIGSSQMVICAGENSDLAEHLSTDKIAVGMIDGATADKKAFKKYCRQNNIDARLVPYRTGNVLKDALKSSAVDAVFAERWDVNNYQILARFGAGDMYFAVKKGNTQLLGYLNEGLEKIEADSPEYQKLLYEKYYARHDITGTVLSRAEKEFIETLEPVIVAVPGNMAPLQKEDENGKFSGIHMEILNAISKKTGIVFSYVNAGTMNEAVSFVKEKKADVLCGVVDNINWADTQELLLTSSYMDNVQAIVKLKDHSALAGKSVLAEFNHNVRLSGYYNSSILQCGSLEECFAAVKEQNADFTFGNIYAVDYLKARAAYRDFDVSVVSENGGAFCFAMRNDPDLTLYHIMNKAIKSMDAEMVEEVVANAVMERRTEFSLLGYIYDHTLGVILMIFAVLFLVVLVFLHFMRKTMTMERQLSEECELLEQKYHAMMEITGDGLFEYNPKEDSISLSRSLSKKFGVEEKQKNFRKFKMLERRIHPNDIPAYEEFVKDILTRDFCDRQIQLRVENGKQEYEKMYIYASSVQKKGEKPEYLVGRFFDENTKIIERKRGIAFRGVYSYLEIKDMILHCLEQSEYREKHVMILMNIHNHVEKETYEGREPLLRAADCIQTCVRETEDIIGRSGDEQLLLFMTRIQSREQIENKLDRIRQLLREEFYSDNVDIMVGYSVYPLQGGNYEELYEKAASDMTEL